MPGLISFGAALDAWTTQPDRVAVCRGPPLADHLANFPVKLEGNKWYTLVVETVGQEMRVSIDGKPVAYFKSAGSRGVDAY